MKKNTTFYHKHCTPWLSGTKSLHEIFIENHNPNVFLKLGYETVGAIDCSNEKGVLIYHFFENKEGQRRISKEISSSDLYVPSLKHVLNQWVNGLKELDDIPHISTKSEEPTQPPPTEAEGKIIQFNPNKKKTPRNGL